MRDQVTVNGLFDCALHVEFVLLISRFEHLAARDGVVKIRVAGVGAVEELLIIGVKGRVPGLDQIAHVGRQVVLGAQCGAGDGGVFGDSDAVGDGGVDPVFDRAEGIGVCFEERDHFEGWFVDFSFSVWKVESRGGGRSIRVGLPEFQTGENASAKPRPTRSKASFRPADMSSIGANVSPKRPIWVTMLPSALPMAS